MEFEEMAGAQGVYRVINTGGAPLVADGQSALDLIGTAGHRFGDVKLIIDKADIDETFFDLRTGIAGEVLQKFVNYHVAVAIVGNFGGYTSKSLRDFIYESNKGASVFFVGDAAAAVEKLLGR